MKTCCGRCFSTWATRSTGELASWSAPVVFADLWLDARLACDAVSPVGNACSNAM
jgi:hypothetical protein